MDDKQRKLLLITGNGFDRRCGLKSSYRDYFISKRQMFQKVDEWINKYCIIDRLSEFIGRNCSNYDIFKPQTSLPQEMNFWDLVFYLSSRKKSDDIIDDINWCDIEKIISNCLKNTYTLDDSRSPNNTHNVYIKTIIKVLSYSYKHNEINDISVGIGNYNIINKNSLICAVYLRMLDDKALSPSEVYRIVFSHLKTFENEFGKYIGNQCFDKTYQNNACKLTTKLSKKKGEIVGVTTFNYSYPFGESNYADIPLSFVNGDFESPIFGIDSNGILPNDSIFMFTKTSRRMESELVKYKEYIEVNYDDIIIYGHSLNEQDYSFFFALFDHIDISNNLCKNKVIFAYSIYNVNKKEEIIKNQRMMISNLISEYDIYHNHYNQNRLLDFLTVNHKIQMVEIE